MNPERPELYGMLPPDLEAHLARVGVPARPEETRRILARAMQPPREHARRRALRKEIEHAALTSTKQSRLEVVERVRDDADGFVKYLFRSPDGALSEAVRIPLHKENCFTVCLSSQVGCAMQCTFCATGRLGLTRHLEAWEIVSTFLTVRDEAPGRVTGAVFMGQGEPLHNYDNVIQAARILSDPCGASITGKAITISTVGLVPQIRRYAREKHPYRLIISLTSAIAKKRADLLPVAGRFSLEEVSEAIREYAATTKGRVTIAWVVMSGVNTGADEVDALRALLADLRLRVNLIDINDAREDGFRRADEHELKGLIDKLQVLGVPIVRRYSGGAQRHAACGMLAATRFEGAPDPSS